MNKAKKFKVLEKDAENAPVKDIQWEGEELQAQSKTHLEDDQGTGQKMVVRFFEFGANPKAFKQYKPTAQELFDSHRHGIMALLWKDELQPYEGISPRIIFSPNRTHYRIVITCLPRGITGIIDNSQTLTQLLTK